MCPYICIDVRTIGKLCNNTLNYSSQYIVCDRRGAGRARDRFHLRIQPRLEGRFRRPEAGVGGSDAFASRIANSGAWQVTTDEDGRLNYGYCLDIAHIVPH